MQLCKFFHPAAGTVGVGVLTGERVQPLNLTKYGLNSLSDLLHAEQPAQVAAACTAGAPLPLTALTLLPPMDRQEVWAAGVTYKRSQEARERESAGAARFYDLVYSASRPELFFKALPERVAGPGTPVRIRADSKWNVPEPELALVISPRLQIVGCTIGNDMSSRDIEGENPLYLPQAKVYDRSCALGPVVTLRDSLPSPDHLTIRLIIERGGTTVFDGATQASAMKRSFEELVSWLGKENSFPHGAILLTGTGIVPPDEFTLTPGDVVTIEIAGIGKLVNVVELRAS